MSFRRYGALALFALVLVLMSAFSVVHGQCASCGQSAVPAASYQWEQSATDSDCWGLRLGGVQVGAWRQSDGRYHPYFSSSNSWGVATRAPIAPPIEARTGGCNCCDSCPCDGDSCPCKLGKEPCSRDCKCLLGTARPEANYGVVTEKIGEHGERYTLGGAAISRRQAVESIGGPASIPDDRAKPSLSICGGTDAERSAAVAAAKQAGLDAVALVQDYPADSPLLKPGFVVPGVYLQAMPGKVLARTPSISPDVYAAVRKAVPEYDPKKDPDPTRPALGLSLADLEKKLAELPGWAWAVVGAVGVYLFLKHKEAAK